MVGGRGGWSRGCVGASACVPWRSCESAAKEGRSAEAGTASSTRGTRRDQRTQRRAGRREMRKEMRARGENGGGGEGCSTGERTEANGRGRASRARSTAVRRERRKRQETRANKALEERPGMPRQPTGGTAEAGRREGRKKSRRRQAGWGRAGRRPTRNDEGRKKVRNSTAGSSGKRETGTGTEGLASGPREGEPSVKVGWGESGSRAGGLRKVRRARSGRADER